MNKIKIKKKQKKQSGSHRLLKVQDSIYLPYTGLSDETDIARVDK